MRATTSVDELRDGVQKVLNIVDKKSYVPILTYCLINTNNNYIEISASNSEISSRIKISAQVEDEGIFCLNAKNLHDILRELPSKDVILASDDSKNTLSLTCDQIHFSLFIYSSEDFPSLTFEGTETVFKAKAKDFNNILDKTAHAISDDETRLYLNGVYIQEVDSKIRAVATDGYRLSLVDSDINSDNVENLINGIIIPRKGVAEIRRVAESDPDTIIEVSVDNSFVYVNAEDRYNLSVRLIAREYPKYQTFIPAKSSFIVRTDRGIFMDAVKRIKIMSNEKSNGVRVKLSGSEMVLTAQNPALGDADERLEVDYNGEDMEIGFNAKYLIDTLSVFDEGEISVELNNELSPVVIKSNTHPNYLGLIMPLK